MLQKNNHKIPELLLIFSLFFLSNATAFLHVVWIVPEIVFLESVVWLILAALFIWILNKNKLTSRFIENLRRNWVILPFLIFSGLSIFWSVYWEISLCRWLIFLFTVVTGGYVGLRYSMKEIVRLLSVFGIYILLLSSVYVFFIPKVGVMNYYIIQGAWKGLYWHKNHMGLIAAFINTLFLINLVYSLQSKEKNILLWLPLYLFSLLFVYQSDTVAAYITTIFLHGLILLAFILLKFKEKIRTVHYLVFALAMVSVSAALYINADFFFELFNRSPTLTGRIPMWTYLFDTYFSRKPFAGYGFNAFWYIDSHRVDIGLAAGYPDPIVIADNGFIDILMNTGYLGSVLFLLFYLGAWRRSIKYAATAIDINGMFPVILMSYTLIANISWSLIFENEGFFMLIMIAVLFCISAGSAGKHGPHALAATEPS